MMEHTDIYLRDLRAEDVNENYLGWFREDEVLQFLEVDGKSLTYKDVVDYMEGGRNSGEFFMHAICLKSNDKHIGNLKIGPILPKHGVSGLPCVIGDRNYWGKGLATQAIWLGSQLAFDKYNIRKLHGRVYAKNIGSIKAYCRAGWIVEGVIKDRYVVNNELMDQVLISCHNPKYFTVQDQTNYNVEKLIEAIRLRESFFE